MKGGCLSNRPRILAKAEPHPNHYAVCWFWDEITENTGSVVQQKLVCLYDIALSDTFVNGSY